MAERVLRVGRGDGAERVEGDAEHDRERETGGPRGGDQAREQLALGLLRHQEDLAVDVAGLDQLERVGVVQRLGPPRLGEETSATSAFFTRPFWTRSKERSGASSTSSVERAIQVVPSPLFASSFRSSYLPSFAAASSGVSSAMNGECYQVRLVGVNDRDGSPA